MNNDILNKEASLEKAKSICENWRKENKKIVFTNGCFDIIHAGHVTYLQQAKNLGDYLVLGLNSDKSIQNLKGPKRPLTCLKERIIVLSSLVMIDLIVVFDELRPNNLIAELKPDIHVKGGDYKPEELPEYPIVKGYGGEVRILPFLPGASTTGLINKIIEKHK
ncbi:D-glycero-beta-D-manno-heptose 1-phosphate adenylyltransferase [Candidatus Margulisiibacteriota bacterium]